MRTICQVKKVGGTTFYQMVQRAYARSAVTLSLNHLLPNQVSHLKKMWREKIIPSTCKSSYNTCITMYYLLVLSKE